MHVSLKNYLFEDYLREANRAVSADDLFSVLMKAVGQYGFNNALFALVTDHNDIGKKANSWIARSYSDSWKAHCSERWGKNIDPVAANISKPDDAFRWDGLSDLLQMNKEEDVFIHQSGNRELCNSIAIPLRGSAKQLAVLGFATTERRNVSDCDLDMVSAYGNHFYAAYKRLYQGDGRKNIVLLTPKEREVLSWVAAGKTDAEIATILNLSRNTVDAHMRKVFKKLNANSRVLASVKAISMGLIHI